MARGQGAPAEDDGEDVRGVLKRRVETRQHTEEAVRQQEVEQLDSAGVTGPRPPSPSELHKVGSSMRPSLEAQGPAPSVERSRPPSGSAEEQKRRPHSLSIMPEAFNSDEELEEILEEEVTAQFQNLLLCHALCDPSQGLGFFCFRDLLLCLSAC